jgi:hypothetical protein
MFANQLLDHHLSSATVLCESITLTFKELKKRVTIVEATGQAKIFHRLRNT